MCINIRQTSIKYNETTKENQGNVFFEVKEVLKLLLNQYLGPSRSSHNTSNGDQNLKIK